MESATNINWRVESFSHYHLQESWKVLLISTGEFNVVMVTTMVVSIVAKSGVLDHSLYNQI